ncbi:hypothetical protein K435DRAFT_939012 [Dendrothele bispora CBS 962.96]|uniref:DUF6589 domain-containing protein n=1 Tax=Dendrothele bispora (strain CBS 962.96) TaxID=1314807 RepID=A0A4S8MAS7_DENBC|nr:hypothetical protein K435DRAFT_939012 [Dendrothele bispora CBS 962.96]
MEYLVQELKYTSVAEFFYDYLEPIPRRSSNNFDTSHRNSVSSFLQGRMQVKPVDLVQRIFDHRYSFPSSRCKNKDEERKKSYSDSLDPRNISYARCSLSTWATQAIGSRVYRDIQKLIHPSPILDDDTPHISSRLVSSANLRTRAKGVKTVTKSDLLSFKLSDRIIFFKKHAPLVWYLTDCMASSRNVERKRRSPSIVQVAAISSFVLARNQYANGYWAMQNGIWHIACQSHVDVRRIDCHKGASVHDTTARRALATIAEDSLEGLRVDMAKSNEEMQMSYRWVLDNIQQFLKVWEAGIGRDNLLVTGCAGTAIGMQDIAPGAFDLKDHVDRILKHDSAELTVHKLWASIDWNHISGVQSIHVLLALIYFIPDLKFMEEQANNLLRSRYAIHRMREGRKTVLVPLGTNSEREIETEGMKRSIHDFLQQSGFKPEYASHLIAWFGGDGGSVLAMDRAKRYLSLHHDPDDPQSDYNTLHNLLPTIGIWHTQATNQNTIAENHYGPAVTNDPSALSRSASCANFKRPSNFKDCGNYYPLHRSMSTFWNAQIIDCWRLELGLSTHTEMLTYFEERAKKNELQDFNSLLATATRITARWVSLESISQALCCDGLDSLPDDIKFPIGDPYPNSPNQSGQPYDPDIFMEVEGFEGDRVLANSIIFKWEYSLWIELAYAVPEGDIGRVWEIMKIWIFIFAGGGNSNYRDLLLEMYCLFRYKSSKDLKDAIWNNWLVNVTGEVGKWIPDDLLQEHYNRWLEELLKKSNGDFDNQFLRKVISPNVEFFLRLKEEFETALGLHHRSKSHTSPHLRAEYQQLLTMYREDKLHVFQKGRSMGHAATDLFNEGVKKLKLGSLKAFLDKESNLVEVLRDMEELRHGSSEYPSPTPPLSPLICSPSPQSPIPYSRNLSPLLSDPSNSDSESNFEPVRSDSSWNSIETDGQSDKSDFEAEETDLLAFKQVSSRLNTGLELTPTTDAITGRLVSDWLSNEELRGISDDELERDDYEEQPEKGLSDDNENWDASDSEDEGM